MMNRRFAFIAAGFLLAAALPAFCGPQGKGQRGTEGPDAGLSLIQGRPTDVSATLSVLSATAVEVCVEYGPATGARTAKTEAKSLKAGEPGEIEIGGLKPGTRYAYRLLKRTPGAAGFQPGPEGSFQTQRPPGSTFTFGVQGDSHPERQGKMFDPALYNVTLRAVAKDAPDFYFLMGDDFSIERLIERGTVTQEAVNQVYAHQRTFLGELGRTSAIFLVNGNHEQAALSNLNGKPDNPAVTAGRARIAYFPLPDPGAFYGGDKKEVPGVGRPRDYYSWTWGDALFVVIDPYWHSPVTVDNEAGSRAKGGKDKADKQAAKQADTAGGAKDGGKAGGKGGGAKGGGKGGGKGENSKRDLWNVTLGDEQYHWLEKTLTESKARWKFVFTHHVLGTGRGGIEEAGLYEWGGKDRNGQSLFAEKRPGWELPIHQLMVKTGVTIFFQGHDHIYAHQELDGVVYQSCPNPADPTYQAFNRDAYRSGDVLPNSGHLRVTVTPESVRVEYVRAFLPADEKGADKTGVVAHSYTIPAKRKGDGK
jgi:hypothetical protein